MTIWVGSICSHSFGIEKVGKPYFFCFFLTLEWDLQKGEYERDKKPTKKNKILKYNSIYIYSGIKSRGIKQR